MGSWNFFVSLATELAVSKIVGNEEYDVGHILSGRDGESAGYEEEANELSSPRITRTGWGIIGCSSEIHILIRMKYCI